MELSYAAASQGAYGLHDPYTVFVGEVVSVYSGNPYRGTLDSYPELDEIWVIRNSKVVLVRAQCKLVGNP